jgi:hypothetical protein
MAKRPGAVAVTGGALLALLCPGVAAAAQDEGADTFPREVSGGYASWHTSAAELKEQGVSPAAVAPAVRGGTDRTWFPATGGGTDPETGDADVELAGTAVLTAASGSLSLGGLRLELDGDTGGALYARATVDGQDRELALADITPGAEPAVRTSGVTWSGLEASLTTDGAALLSAWSGSPFAAGDAFGVLDVTVGTGSAGDAADDTAPAPDAGSPEPSASPTGEKPAAADRTADAAPTAAVTSAALAPGAEQRVTGAGFEPGEVVLVAIDEDTRYQVTADEAGQVSRTFPVYDTATEGAHTVELYTVTGERRADAEFAVG